MSGPRILVTDYSWPTLDEERGVLADVDGTLVVAERGDEPELIDLAADVDAILTCWKNVTAAVLDSAPRRRVVSRYGVGLDNIAVARATDLGMVVTRVPDYCIEEVADHTMALLLASARRVVQLDAAVRAGVWDNTACGPIPRLRGQVLGLIGFGAIARQVAERAVAFGLEVVAWVRGPRPAVAGVRFTSDLDEVLALADFVSLHVPSTDETRHLIGAPELAAMKPTAFVVNTARGLVIDEDALARALDDGAIAGAALDVLSAEPPGRPHPLLGRTDVIVTPHAGFYSEASIRELARKAMRNAIDLLGGTKPPEAYVVNAEVLLRPGCRVRLREA